MDEVVRSLRIKNEYDQIVKDASKKEGISINSFFNRLLEKYLMTYRFVKIFPLMIIPRDIIKEFITEMPEPKIIESAKKMGAYVPKHSIFLEGKKSNPKTCLEFMEKVVGQHSNWYQFNSQTNNGKIKLLLRHDLGKNWSIFLDTYYKTMFKQLFDLTITNEVGDDSLIIKIPKNQKPEESK